MARGRPRGSRDKQPRRQSNYVTERRAAKLAAQNAAHEARAAQEDTRTAEIVALRAAGHTLAQIAERYGITGALVRQIITSSGTPSCRRCRLPVELVPGRRLCRDCYAAMMAYQRSSEANQMIHVNITEIVALRAAGHTLAQIAERYSITGERVRQIIAASGTPLCRGCRLPVELVPGRRLCRDCYAAMMAERPSKRLRRTGYRRSSARKRTAWMIRLAKQGLTPVEIAERMGIAHGSVLSALYKLRKRGHTIPVADGRKRR